MWASARAAYESLSPEMKNLFDGLEAEHDFRQGFKESLAEPVGKERLKSALENYPKVSHSVVLQHPEIDKRSLFVNALLLVNSGFDRHGEPQIIEIFEHIVTEEFTVRLRWKKGTLAIWDNRSTQHKPVNDFSLNTG